MLTKLQDTCIWSGFTQSLISTLENTTKVKLTLETYPLFKESLKSLFASFCFKKIKTNKKLTLYSNIKSIYSIEPYLKIKDYKCRQFVSKFRMLDHCLPIETGRFNSIPENERVCPHCTMNNIGDEEHTLLHCTNIQFVPV